MNRFDALTLSLAELALNVLFALLFLLHADSLLPRHWAPNAPEGGAHALIEELEEERDALTARLEASRETEAYLQRQIDEVYGRMVSGGLSDLRPNCRDELFEGTVVSASTIRIAGEELPISDLDRRFPGTDRRVKKGCVHKIRVRFESMHGHSYEKALRALENRYRVYREDS